MSTEWYLLKSPYNQLSGYEGEALNDFAEEGFLEALDSEISVPIELCNCDLSQCKPMKAIVQNNVQDTKLKALSRHLFLPIGTCKAGMYVKYKNRYWLIVGLVDDNKMYEKAVMVICNYLLTWVNKHGAVVQRWANITSASQYNNGETNSKFYAVRSDQLLVLTSNDDEVLLLDTGTRFIIDRRCRVYEKNIDNSTLKDVSNPVITYTFTRADNVLFDYQDSGHAEFMVTQEEQRNENDGYYVIDGKGYWLCEQPKSDNKITTLSCAIECDSNEIYDGLEAGIFVAKFYDTAGKETNETPQWEIICDFKDKLDVSYADNSILISVDNAKLINKSFELLLSADGYKSTSITVMVKAFL